MIFGPGQDAGGRTDRREDFKVQSKWKAKITPPRTILSVSAVKTSDLWHYGKCSIYMCKGGDSISALLILRHPAADFCDLCCEGAQGLKRHIGGQDLR